MIKRKKAGALVLVCVLSILAQIGCGPPSPATLRRIADGGLRAQHVLEANQSLPDQLLIDKVITQKLHDQIVDGVKEALSAGTDFNEGMAKVLADPNHPDLKPLVPLAFKFVQRINALNVDAGPLWRTAISGVEVGLRAVANYFAITIGELRQQGFNDRQICARFGVEYDPQTFALLEKYGNDQSVRSDTDVRQDNGE